MRKIVLIIIIIFAAQSTAFAWYNSDWQYKKEITIDHTKVSANQANFPLLIDIIDPDLKSKAQLSGKDILFTNDSDNKLSHEIELYDPAAGHLVAWVRIPYLSSSVDTRIFIYYGNSAASSQENPESVWDSNYLAVYHLNETSGTVYDSTKNHLNGVPKGSMNQNVAGKIDGADSFDGINDSIALPRVFNTEKQFTIETWMNTGNKQGYAVSQWASNIGAFIQYYPTGGSVQFYVNNISLTKPIPQNQWIHVVGTFNGTKSFLYVNGSTPVSTAASLSWPSNNTAYIGNRQTLDRPFLGRLDEIRLSNISRNVDYVRTTFNNQNNPGTFYSVGVEMINDLLPVLNSITVAPSSTALNPGGIQQFTATARDQNNAPLAGINISWTSSNRTVGTVSPSYSITDSSGIASATFNALTPGNSMVNATNGTEKGSGSVTVNAGSDWYNTNWPYRKKITINHSQVSAGLANFPLLIDISDTDLQLKAQSNGNDILFTDTSNNKLNHEIELYNSSTGHLIVWVNAPFLSTSIDTQLYMYYGNNAAPPQENPEGVWDSNYLAVYHLNETGGTVYDSTKNHLNGIPKGGMNQNVAGKIDGADSFDGINDSIALPRVFNTEKQFTIETWMNTGNKQGYAVSQWASNIGAFIQYYPTGGNVQFYVNNISLTKPIPQNQWIHVVGTFNGTRSFLYVNGSTPISTAANLSWPSNNTAYIGNRQTLDRPFLGKLDEIRLSNISRSKEYIQTTFNNQNNPGTFYNIGNEDSSSAQPYLKSIIVSPSSVTMTSGESRKFNATARDQFGNPVKNVKINWTLSNGSTGGINPVSSTTDIYGNATTIFSAFSYGNTLLNATNATIRGSARIIISLNNSPPQISNETPANGSTNVNLNPVLSVYAGDASGDLLNITFSYYNGSGWVVLKSYTSLPSGTYTAETAGNMSAPNTTYRWKVVASDKSYKTEKIFNLTTGSILHLKWRTSLGGGGGQFIPVMGDINKDGDQEIVIARGGSINAYNGKTGTLEWTVGGGSYSNVELIDLDGDGTPEVVAPMTNPPRVRAINGNGTIRWTSPQLSGEILPLFPIIGYDIDGDGYPTIYFATADITPEPYSGNLSDYTGRITMLDYKGNPLAETWVYRPCWGGMSLGDVNFDGQFELYLGDRGGPFYTVPTQGLRAFNAHTLQSLWNRSDILTSSPMPILANVTGDKNLEIIASYVVNNGTGVLNATTGSTILDYFSRSLLNHGTGTLYDIDGDGHKEIMFAEGESNTSPKQFVVFDLITGKIKFQPTLDYNIAWPPSAGDVNGDGKMEILAGAGLEGNTTGSYPIYIYDGKYNLLETDMIPNAGQLTPPRVFDVDSDGYNELVVSSNGGILSVYDTSAKTPDPAPRTWNQWYSEYRQGAAEYVPPPGPMEPVIRYENPKDNTENVQLNPILSAKAFDFQKDTFNITFEIFDGVNWQALASYMNQKVNKFTEYTANTAGYVNASGKTYQWRVRVKDSKGNADQKTFTFKTEPAPAPWWNSNWHNRKRIDINHNNITGNLANFPLLIKLSDNDLRTHAKNNGDDIVFTTYNGTKLNHEIESYNSSTGNLIAWVNIPALSSTQDTILYMYYNNSLSPNQENPEGVWNSNYSAVYHFNDPAGTVYDSTLNHNNGIPNGSLNQNVPGKIGGADDFDGINDFIDLPKSNMTAGMSEVTLELWVNMDEFVLNRTIWDEYYSRDVWQFSINSGKWYTRDSSTGPTGTRNNDVTMPAITPGEWHQFTFVYSVSQKLKGIYLDGKLVQSTNYSIETLTNTRDKARIGYASDGLNFNGKMDEVRVSHTARDANWIATSYMNQNNPGSGYTARQEESQG